MSYLPDLSKLSSRLAEDNRRVSDFVESLTNKVDLLVGAAKDENWGEVQRICEYLTNTGQSFGYPIIANAARDICAQLEKAETGVEMKRKMIRLIGACGKIDRPEKTEASE